jgi:ABC-type multidrug transport system fused ATPase/permease subunit
MWPISTFLSRIVKTAIFLAAIYLFRDDFIKGGIVQIGAITAMVSYSNRFWGPIQQIGMIYNQLMDAMSYLERIFQVLDEPVRVSITGSKDTPKTVQLLESALQSREPRKVVQVMDPKTSGAELREMGYELSDEPKVYICHGTSCRAAITDAAEVATAVTAAGGHAVDLDMEEE